MNTLGGATAHADPAKLRPKATTFRATSIGLLFRLLNSNMRAKAKKQRYNDVSTQKKKGSQIRPPNSYF